MNRIGMLVDISHVAPATMHAALDVSRAPVIFSHSSCRALTDHVRDVPDDVLRQARRQRRRRDDHLRARTSSRRSAPTTRAAEDARRHELGLDKVTVYTEHDRRAPTTRRRWPRSTPGGPRIPRAAATLAQVADHVEHAREVAGRRRTSGSAATTTASTSLPVGLEDVSTYPALLAELADRGWSDADLAALTCGNILRVLQSAEEVADRGFGPESTP